MKIIGKAKGKAPKAWCLMQDSESGHFHVGYDGHWPLHGSFEEVTAKVAAAKAALKSEPVILPKENWPGFHPHNRPSHASPLTQEQLDEYEKYQKYTDSKYAHNQWLQEANKSNVVPFDYVPVFEDELRFTGYTRGRSSVTMTFEASNGQTIEFGPSGIDGLIQGIIDGTAQPQAISGTYEDDGEYDSEKGERVNRKTLPRGRGIKAIFKFVKKGQNTYAELVDLKDVISLESK